MAVLLGLGLLASCGGDRQDHRQTADDDHDVAMVERMNQIHYAPIRPEPLTADDMVRYDLGRESCTFRSGSDAAGPPLFVTQHDRGYIKIAGRLQPLAAKGGSAELPSGAHSTYVGMNSWIELVAQPGPGATEPAGTQAWPSRLVIHDSADRVAFDTLGQVLCRGA